MVGWYVGDVLSHQSLLLHNSSSFIPLFLFQSREWEEKQLRQVAYHQGRRDAFGMLLQAPGTVGLALWTTKKS